MFSKAKLNFVVDAMILVAFLVAAISGVVLLTMSNGGYRGGRNPDFGQTVLFLDQSGWNDLHVWGSFAMIAGIVVHLALHWRWIVCTAKRFVRPRARATLGGGVEPCPVIVNDTRNSHLE